jgi:RHS repeat-associated protein
VLGATLADENGSGTTSWYLKDREGTTRDVLQYNSGTNTTTDVDQITYGAFGNITAQSNSAYQPIFAYTGQLWDTVIGLYYDNARWYDPNDGRFISQDPTGFAAGDDNLYRYVGNDPTNATDPTGTTGVDADPANPSDTSIANPGLAGSGANSASGTTPSGPSSLPGGTFSCGTLDLMGGSSGNAGVNPTDPPLDPSTLPSFGGTGCGTSVLMGGGSGTGTVSPDAPLDPSTLPSFGGQGCGSSVLMGGGSGAGSVPPDAPLDPSTLPSFGGQGCGSSVLMGGGAGQGTNPPTAPLDPSTLSNYGGTGCGSSVLMGGGTGQGTNPPTTPLDPSTLPNAGGQGCGSSVLFGRAPASAGIDSLGVPFDPSTLPSAGGQECGSGALLGAVSRSPNGAANLPGALSDTANPGANPSAAAGSAADDALRAGAGEPATGLQEAGGSLFAQASGPQDAAKRKAAADATAADDKAFINKIRKNAKAGFGDDAYRKLNVKIERERNNEVKVTVVRGTPPDRSTASSDQRNAIITIHRSLSEAEATDAFIFEMHNLDRGLDFNANHKAARLGNLSKEAYVKAELRIEFENQIAALPISKAATKLVDPKFVSPMQKTANLKEFKIWYDSLNNTQADRDYKSYYEDTWDDKFKAAYEKKHPKP